MIGLWNVQWLNQNSQRSYPLCDFGEKTTKSDPGLRIPDDFILALRISVNTGIDVNIENFFIKSIVVSGAGCTVTFGYSNGSREEDVAIAYLNTTEEIINCKLVGVGNFDDTVGYAAFSGTSPVIQEWLGYYEFSHTSTPIEPECIVPMLRGVSSMSIDDAGSVSNRYYGDMELVAGANISLSASKQGNLTRIVINALNTDDFCEDCICELHDDLPCIKSISGVHADTSGNIVIKGTECLTVNGAGNKLVLSDTCAKPDCGCDELNGLADSVRELENGVATLKAFINQLYAVFAQTNQAIVSSNKSSDGCGTVTNTESNKIISIIPY